ncbi:putative neutral ceramidase superfamily lipid hydrolase [Neisseria sp. HSC-16F19]|nr:hypothetical protein [Neisseria sp. HSC-16F19]MCP2041385.1 putative neutral ceramidase superfamily lipid hydrolase [Neisseria sp. HSC-16F19]
MLNRPEELIMAVLAGLWVVLTYLLADYIGIHTHTALLITALSLIWAAVFFMLWQRSRIRWIWPLFLGLLVACWWPALDWLAVKDIAMDNADGLIVLSRPWYATWTAKLIYAAIPILIGYIIIWKLSHHPARNQMIP